MGCSITSRLQDSKRDVDQYVPPRWQSLQSCPLPESTLRIKDRHYIACKMMNIFQDLHHILGCKDFKFNYRKIQHEQITKPNWEDVFLPSMPTSPIPLPDPEPDSTRSSSSEVLIIHPPLPAAGSMGSLSWKRWQVMSSTDSKKMKKECQEKMNQEQF